MLLQIRTQAATFEYEIYDGLLLLVISGDFIIKTLILYLMVKFGGDLHYVASIPQLYFLRGKSDRKNFKHDSENYVKLQQVKNTLSESQYRAFIAVFLLYQVVNLAIVIWLGLLFNVLIELLIFLSIFFIGRNLLGSSLHSNSMILCFIITVFVFIFVCATMIPLQLNLFSPIIYAATICLAMYHFNHMKDHRRHIEWNK